MSDREKRLTPKERQQENRKKLPNRDEKSGFRILNPSKRLKGLHRKSEKKLSLKEFARDILETEKESKLIEAWQTNKGIVL